MATATATGLWMLALLAAIAWSGGGGDASPAETETNALDGGMMADLSRQYRPGYDGCPLCDASVYGYCSHKIIHDSCCCNFPASAKPPQCYYYDCNLLYAKSCYEHLLIKNCCCNSPY